MKALVPRVGMIGVAVLLLSVAVRAQNYLTIIARSPVIEIRGETADTIKIRSTNDRYIEDNLDYLLANNEWLVVNFSTYWCPDSRSYRPGFDSVAAMPEYAGIRWAYADIDGTAGNENFRKRFGLPGIPVTILFHHGEIVVTEDGERSVLDGHLGDKTAADLRALLKRFYQRGSAR